jgi:putative hydrolases of HD superfamily
MGGAASMEGVVNFLFELGNLKRVMRSGWWVGGVKTPETVAEHVFRTAWVGFVLARMEGADAGVVVMMCLAHDLHEARLNDQHKVGQAYLDPKPVEAQVLADQVAALPGGADLSALFAEYEGQKTLEAKVARDADRLECAVQSLEYVSQGQGACRPWFENARPGLQTKAGRALHDALAGADPHAWYQNLPRVT